MSDTKNKSKPDDASILDYYRRTTNNNPVKQTIGAVFDLGKNWLDMVNANTLDADKYFHCKGNCEASQRGLAGEFSSTILSDAREYYQMHIKRPRETLKAAMEDQEANIYGRTNKDEHQSCRNVCQKYRVRGMNEKY